MTEDLDTTLKQADPDRWLSSRFVADAERREDVVAIYAFDNELARAPRVASNPLLGEIRLTWWREVLDEVYGLGDVRQHPVAQALARAIRRHDLPRDSLEAMIDARYRELDPAPMAEAEALEWASDTGGRAAELAARVLDEGADTRAAALAGTAWALSFRAAKSEDLEIAFEKANHAARRAARGVKANAFPAVAHGVFASDRAAGLTRGDFARRMRLILAVATGRL